MTDRNKKKILIGACAFIFVGIIAIAYATFTQGLNINGSGVNRKSNFDIHFANLSSPTIVGTANVATAPTIQNNSTVIEDYSITLATPKDSVSYTFDIVNDGDYDATLKGLTVGPVKCSVNGNESDQSAVNVCQNIEYTLKYADGSTLQTNNDRLLSKETKHLKLTLTYKEFNDASKLPTNNVSISNLGIELVYEADNQAKTNSDGSTPYETSSYTVGQELTVKGDKYNILSVGSDYLTLLKQEPLTVTEIEALGMSADYNYEEEEGTSTDWAGVIYDDDSSDYANSEIKYVVDAWATDKFQNDELKKVDNYKARLISFDEVHSFGFGDEPQSPCGPSCGVLYYPKTDAVPSWLYNSNYWYWTISGKEGSSSDVWYVDRGGNLRDNNVNANNGAVRPVINLYKSKL